jgi:tetratricopeptide (TPR) repeat protein
MGKKRTCFVISPIGDEGSATRQNADDVFDLLIQPAVEPFDFEVIRADKIPGPYSINEEVIRLVQESDLCIADLTERNPNVFYECGRRHETGKPVILVIRKGEKIPFDLAGIRTISYDLSDARKSRDSVISVQEFVREVEKNGFAESSSGATLASLTEILARIERKLTVLATGGGQAGAPNAGATYPGASSGESRFRSMLRNPSEALHEAVLKGDIPAIVALIPRLERTMGLTESIIAAAAIAAINGEPVAAGVLVRAIESEADDISMDVRKAALGGLVQYYIGIGKSADGLVEVVALAKRLLAHTRQTDSDKAYVNNQVQMLCYAAKMFQDALEYAEEATRLDPNEPAYWLNLSIVFESLELPKKALAAIEQSMELGGNKAAHFSHAFDVYTANDMADKAVEVLEKLKQIDPERAAMASLRVQLAGDPAFQEFKRRQGKRAVDSVLPEKHSPGKD